MTRDRPPWPIAARLIARTEVRRTWRRLRTSGRRNLFAGIAVGFVYGLFGSVGAFFLGSIVAERGLPSLTPARLGALAVLVIGTFLVAQRTVKQTGTLDAPEAVLTATSPAAVAVGLMAAEYARGLLFLGLPAGAIIVAYGLGTGSPLAAAVLAVVALCVMAVVITLGFALGMAFKRATMRSKFVTRHRGKLGVLGTFLAFGTYMFFLEGYALSQAILDPLLALPPAWLGDLALSGTPNVAAGTSHLLGAVGVVLVGVPVCGAIGVAIAPRVWFGERVRPDERSDTTVAGSDLLTWLPQARLPTATLAVVRKSVLRARRSPFIVQYALLPYVFVAMFGVQFAIQNRAIPQWLTPGMAVAGVAATGTAFALNPIGGEEGVLPTTLTSGVAPRAFLAGHVVAGWLLGIPALVLGTVVVGLLLGAPPVTIAGLVVGATGMALGTPGIALAAGVVFPSMETQSLPGGTETVEPSSYAALLFGIVLLIVALPVLIAVTYGEGTVAVTASGVVSVALSWLFGWAGFRYAVRHLDGYVPDPDLL